MKAKIPIVTAGVMLFVAATAGGTTVTVELPELVGELEPYPNDLTAVFDFSTSFIRIDQVMVSLRGTYKPALIQVPQTGEEHELTPEIVAYMNPGIGYCYATVHPAESPFEIEGILSLNRDATWNFLLGGKGELGIALTWGATASGVIVVPGSVNLSGGSLEVQGVLPEPATVLLLIGGIFGIRLNECRSVPKR